MNIADFLPHQVMLWESIFRGEAVDDAVSCGTNTSEKKEGSLTDYLQRGEFITTCARTKQRRKRYVSSMAKILSTNALHQKTGYNKVIYAKNKIIAEILRPVCNEIAQKGEDTGVFDFAPFLALFEPELEMQISLTEGSGKIIMKELCRKQKAGDKIVPVTIRAKGVKERVCPLNGKLSERKSGCTYYLRAFRSTSRTQVGDVGLFCVGFLIQSELLRYLKSIPLEERTEDRLWSYLYREADKKLESFMSDGIMKVGADVLENSSFGRFIKEHRLPYCKCADGENGCIHVGDTAVFDYLELAPGAEERGALCVRDTLFELLMDEFDKDVNSEEFQRELSSKATVWMTKKNIPEKMIRAMQESDFNDYFGYVEFDEECDIAALKEIEKEWQAIQSILKGKAYEDIALRFRKLGNHHASGLYFPTIRCLCVDMRTPSSMVHEYFHLLDFENGELSRKESFRKCEYFYRECLCRYIDSLPKNHPVRTKWWGSSKYNRNYYLEPTEIFARCGEMYMVHVLGVDNSLCRPEKGFAYPEDETLLGAIKAYFDKFFHTEQSCMQEAAKNFKEV